MPDFRFGDMVYNKHEGGSYMVVGPYVGPRLAGDDKRPAVWVADIDTTYMKDGDGSATWIAVDELEPADE